jgi:hypothetical protein
MVLPFILVRLRITDCIIELDADVGFCGLQEVHRGKTLNNFPIVARWLFLHPPSTTV